MTNNYDFNNFKKDDLTRPKDKCFDKWFKFVKVGDSVQGYIRDVFYSPAKGIYKERRGITLEQPNGELINVAIKRIDWILAKTDKLRLGDPLTVVFDNIIENDDKNDTKNLGFYGVNLPENLNNKTVKQLDEEDRGIVVADVAKANAEFNGEPAVENTVADVPFPSPSDAPTEETK